MLNSQAAHNQGQLDVARVSHPYSVIMGQLYRYIISNKATLKSIQLLLQFHINFKMAVPCL